MNEMDTWYFFWTIKFYHTIRGPKGADGMIISVLLVLYPSLPTLNYYPKPGIKLELENKSF